MRGVTILKISPIYLLFIMKASANNLTGDTIVPVFGPIWMQSKPPMTALVSTVNQDNIDGSIVRLIV
ncbi:hypothetical protein F5880DRAFT_1616016 [Lentinula raphanica]|nr:hypothetical protein F5880DRAFT_1616016 [Lentinula raphanica]